MVISFLALWSICLSYSLVHFKNGPEYLTSGDSPGIYPFNKVPAIEFCLEQFSGSSEIFFFNFFFYFLISITITILLLANFSH